MILNSNTCIRPDNLKKIGGAIPVPDVNGVIYWHLDESVLPTSVDKYQCIQAFEKSFQILSEAFSPKKFVSSGDPKECPIIIKFRNGNEKDIPSGFTEGVLAYSYANYGNTFAYSSDIFFSLKWPWWDMHKPGMISLKKVCVHETLHAMGFDHSDDIKDILFWQYQNNDDIILTEDTRKAIRDFYKLGYDLKLVKEWILGSKGLQVLPESELIRLAYLSGLTLNNKDPKVKNIDLFKKYLQSK
ncbi:MAG TPA: matrixin family metalloprotease [Bacteroidia bacterium]|nr:matrixin family metalloprotease [Bacteroidia bacterium]